MKSFRRTMLISLCLAVAAGTAMADLTRDDVVQRMTAGDRDAVLTAGAGLKLIHAQNLLDAGQTEAAVGVLDEITRMPLPDTRTADKLLSEAFVLLGDAYGDLPGTASRKAIVFYDSGLAHMNPAEDAATMSRTLQTVAGIYRGLGNDAEAFRIDGLATDVLQGKAVDLDLGLGGPAALEDAGDDTCADSVTCTLPHLETMSVTPAGDHNWRDFSLGDASLVRIETHSDDIYGDDTNLNLYGGCTGGNPTDFIEFDDDGGDGFLSLIEICLAPGDYYVEVGGFADTATPDDFDLTIDVLEPCVIPAPDEYEPDDEISLANKIGFRNNGTGQGNQTGRDNRNIQAHSIYPAGDIDFVTFGLSNPNLVRMETSGADNPDTIIGLSDSNGQLLAVNDDKAPGDYSSLLSLCLPKKSDWYVVAVPYFLTDTFPYDFAVDVEVPCQFETEPNGTCGMANPIGLGETISGIQTPGGIGENDYYSFTLDQEMYVEISTSGWDDFNVDTFLELYDGCPGNLLAADDDGGPGYTSLIGMMLPAGTYYVNATVSPFSVGATYPYDLTVEASVPPIDEVEPNDTCGTANPAFLGDTYLASISPTGDRDNFLLSVPSDGYVEVETAGPSGDTVLQVQSADGSVVIGCDDDGGDGLFSLFGCCLPAGDYCVTVREYGDNSTIGDYSVEFRDLGACTPSDPPVCPVNGLGCPF